METENNFNLEGLYNQLKEEDPFTKNAECLDCGKDMITQSHVSYQPQRNEVINFFRPAYCPDCDQGAKSLVVKVFASIDEQGEMYARNQVGEFK